MTDALKDKARIHLTCSTALPLQWPEGGSLNPHAPRPQKFKGVYNGTAPNPVRMGEMCAELGNILGRPSWLPVPGFALQTLLGEGAMVVLEGQKVLPGRATEAQFQFQYSDIRSALRSLVA